MRLLQVLAVALGVGALAFAGWRIRGAMVGETSAAGAPARDAGAAPAAKAAYEPPKRKSRPAPRWLWQHPPARPPAPARPLLPGSEFPDAVGVRSLLFERRFDELTALIEGFQKELEADFRRENLPASALAVFARADRDALPLLDEWVAAKGESFAPWAARGAAYAELGFEARGGDVAAKTTREQFDEMRRHFARAVPDLEAALARRPRLLFANGLLVSVASTASDGARARKAYDDGVTACPECAEVRARLITYSAPRWGGSYERMAELVQAAEPYRAKNRLIGTLAGLEPYDRCLMLINDHPDQALPHCDRAVAAGDARALAMRADIYLRSNDVPRALADLERAVKLTPNDSEVVAFRAHLLVRSGRLDEARRDLARAWLLGGAVDLQAAMRAQHAVSWIATAGWKAHQEHHDDQALALLGEALDLDSDNDDALVWRGWVHKLAGRPAEALRDAEAAVASDPGSYDACNLLDQLLVPRRDFARIVTMWDRFLELEPDDARGWAERAGARHHQGGHEAEARADLHQACTMGMQSACKIESRLGAP